MAEQQLSIANAKATFYALTRAMRPRDLVDNIFIAKPVWAKMRKHMKPVGGVSWQPAIELRTQSGRRYTRKTNLALGAVWSPEIASTADYETGEYLLHVQIPTQDIKKQTSGQGLVDLHKTYMNNAIKSVRKDMSSDLFQTRGSDGTGDIGTGQAVDSVTSVSGMRTLDQCMWYANTYGGVDPTVSNQETWEAHCMYGDTVDSAIEAVAPSMQNFEYIVEQTEGTCDEKPDLIVVSEDTWQALKAQVPAQDYAQQRAAYKDTDIIRWGFSALWVLDVPIVRDRDCYGEAFVPSQTTVKAAKGHDAYGINFNHFKFIYNRNGSFQWHEDGWRHEILDYDCVHNQYFIWGDTACTSRRAQFRMVNIDPTMAVGDFALGTVRLPGADA